MKVTDITIGKAKNGTIVSTGRQVAVFHKRKFALQAIGRFLKTGKLLNRPEAK